jgi:hypothetical protein
VEDDDEELSLDVEADEDESADPEDDESPDPDFLDESVAFFVSLSDEPSDADFCCSDFSAAPSLPLRA